MTSVIIALPKIEEAKGIRNLLMKNGIPVIGVCTSGAQALALTDGLSHGILICGYRLTDMVYSDLAIDLPKGFEMLLIASGQVLAGGMADPSIVSLSMPLKVHDLLDTIEMMIQTIERQRRKQKAKPKERKPEELQLIRKAKELLMDRNHMTEEEAHRYIQKCSMDSGTGMVETAQMVLAMIAV